MLPIKKFIGGDFFLPSIKIFEPLMKSLVPSKKFIGGDFFLCDEKFSVSGFEILQVAEVIRSSRASVD